MRSVSAGTSTEFRRASSSTSWRPPMMRDSLACNPDVISCSRDSSTRAMSPRSLSSCSADSAQSRCQLASSAVAAGACAPSADVANACFAGGSSEMSSFVITHLFYMLPRPAPATKTRVSLCKCACGLGHAEAPSPEPGPQCVSRRG